jgi:hypothetical protein
MLLLPQSLAPPLLPVTGVCTILKNTEGYGKMCYGQALSLTPVILATWEAEIRRIKVWARPGK